jgi:hypothetical protein
VTETTLRCEANAGYCLHSGHQCEESGRCLFKRTVLIEGRTFRIGATYSSRNGFVNRQLQGFDPNGRQPGGTVKSWSVNGREPNWWPARRWCQWVGEEVGS